MTSDDSNPEPTRLDRARGCLLGLAVGDALGAPFEFKRRGFPHVAEMSAGGLFGLEAGQWTDDTAMALCLAESLLERGFEPLDQIARYRRWRDEGYQSSTGQCFGIGGTVWDALARFDATGEAYCGSDDPNAAGNGCLMRLAPVPIHCGSDLVTAIDRSAASARTTHGALECVDATRLLGGMLWRALDGEDRAAILFGHREIDVGSLAPEVRLIAEGAWRTKPRDAISGVGYVIRSLEAALWCFAGTDSFEGALVEAVNLGDDADTTAAICGQLAGAHHGVNAIPERWLTALHDRDRIDAVATRLAAPHAP